MSPDTDRLAKRRRAIGPAGTYIPVIDHARCKWKRHCVEVCPNDVFEVPRIDGRDFKDLGRLSRLS